MYAYPWTRKKEAQFKFRVAEFSREIAIARDVA